MQHEIGVSALSLDRESTKHPVIIVWINRFRAAGAGAWVVSSAQLTMPRPVAVHHGTIAVATTISTVSYTTSLITFEYFF